MVEGTGFSVKVEEDIEGFGLLGLAFFFFFFNIPF